MTLKGGRPLTSASLPAALSFDRITLPRPSRISTHDSPRKRNLRMPPLPAAMTVFSGSAEATGGFSLFAGSAPRPELSGAGLRGSGGLGGSIAGAGLIAAGDWLAEAGAAASGFAGTGSAGTLRANVAGGVGRTKSHQYIAAKATAIATNASA